MSTNTDHKQGAGGANFVPPSRRPTSGISRFVLLAEQSIAAVLLLTIVVLVFAQVIARYIFNAPLFWSHELARYTYVWLTFVAATFVFARGGHISVDIISGFLNKRANELVDIFGKIIVVFTCVFFIWGSWAWVLSNIIPRSSALRMPMVYLFGVVWLCFALMAVHGIAELVLRVFSKVKQKRKG